MKKIAVLLLLLLSLPIAGCGNTNKDKDGGKQMEERRTDQITPQLDLDGADPWITKDQDTYYYTKTTGNNITIFHSGMLTDLAAGEGTVVYEADGGLENFWAPELHRLDGCWYIYFAANPVGNEIHRMYVLSNPQENPLSGEWSCMEMQGMDDTFAIDGTVLDQGKERYFLWSGWEGHENVRQDLYIARMVDPTTVQPEKILLSKPEYDWEMVGEPLVNEGPQVIIRGDTVNLLYSASGSWTNDYCLGLLTARAQDDPCDPSVWTKEKMPVFSSANGVYGPGHNGFAQSPDGSEDYLVYHSARWDGSGWNRSIRLQRLLFDEAGKICPMEPLDSGALMKLPAGEPNRIRFTEKDFTYAGGVEGKPVDSVFETAAVGLEDVQDSVTVTASLQQEGEYTLMIYARVEDCYEEAYRPSLEVTVNGTMSVAALAPSEYYQPMMLRRTLKKGENTIELRSEAGGDRWNIERIELMPQG